MLGIPIRYLLKHPLASADLLNDPRETWTRIVEYYAFGREQRRPHYPYQSSDHWETWLHERLGIAYPCDVLAEFDGHWRETLRQLDEKGVRAGPESFGSWNDGDAGFVRAIWCLIRHLKPHHVVETGVAHGVTSRLILEALNRNETGHLWSIDLPPIERAWREQVGVAVGSGFPDRWSYLKGSSRRRLPQLLSQVGEIDLFVHDSMHSERNVRFELDRAWAALKPGGALVIDDVDANWGFQSFTQAFLGHESVICESEPLRPDLRRFNKKGLFGIILKKQTSMETAA